MVDRAELEAVGLWDPGTEYAEERLALLEYLLGLGATVDDLLEAGAQLPVVPSIVGVRAGSERLTLDEVAERAGMSAGLVARVHRAAGFADPPPGARVFSEADAEVLQAFAASADLLGETATFGLIRVIGSSMARVGDAVVSAFGTNVASKAMAADPVGLELARANADAVSMLPAMVRAMELLLRRHLEQLRRPIPAPGENARVFDTQHLAVGFADLVGSSTLTHQLSTGELGKAFAEFDAQASDAVTARGGRVVKLIGDAVMFVASTGVVACNIALCLAEVFAEHEVLPPGAVRCRGRRRGGTRRRLLRPGGEPRRPRLRGCWSWGGPRGRRGAGPAG
jgi:Adenylate cyclase regulatory domain